MIYLVKLFMTRFLFCALIFIMSVSFCSCANENTNQNTGIHISLLSATIDDILEIYPDTHFMIADPQIYVTRSVTESGDEIICEYRFFNGDFHVISIKSTFASDSAASEEPLHRISDIEIGRTTAGQLSSLYIYNTEYKFNKTYFYIYENGMRYCVTLRELNGLEIVDSICIIDNAAYLESLSNENHSDVSINDFAFIKPAVTTYDEITSLYPDFYTDKRAGYCRIVYTLNDNSHLFIGFDSVNDEMCAAHLYWIINLDEKENLPSATRDYSAPADNIQPYCEQIIIGTDTRSSIYQNYEERKTMETSTGPTSIVMDNDGHWLGLYYSGYGDDKVICIDWLDSTLSHKDVAIDYNPYEISIEK